VDLELGLAEAWQEVGHCKIIGEPYEAEDEATAAAVTELPKPDNSYDIDSGEVIGYCSVAPENEGEEHMFGGVLYSFDHAEGDELFFKKVESNASDITLEAFSELSAADQKALLEKLAIEGDAGNEEKRTALYAAYLEAKKV